MTSVIARSSVRCFHSFWMLLLGFVASWVLCSRAQANPAQPSVTTGQAWVFPLDSRVGPNGEVSSSPALLWGPTFQEALTQWGEHVIHHDLLLPYYDPSLKKMKADDPRKFHEVKRVREWVQQTLQRVQPMSLEEYRKQHSLTGPIILTVASYAQEAYSDDPIFKTPVSFYTRLSDQALHKVRGQAFVVLAGDPNADKLLNERGVSALVQMGGPDLDPIARGEPFEGAFWQDANPHIDAWQHKLMKGAQQRGLFQLNICRSFQLMLTSLGVKLLQHIEGLTVPGGDGTASNKPVHGVPVHILEGTEVHRIYGTDLLHVSFDSHQGFDWDSFQDAVQKSNGTLRLGGYTEVKQNDGTTKKFPVIVEHLGAHGLWDIGFHFHPEKPDPTLGFALTEPLSRYLKDQSVQTYRILYESSQPPGANHATHSLSGNQSLTSFPHHRPEALGNPHGSALPESSRHASAGQSHHVIRAMERSAELRAAPQTIGSEQRQAHVIHSQQLHTFLP